MSDCFFPKAKALVLEISPTLMDFAPSNIRAGTTIRAWLTQRGMTDLPEHHVARTLGVKRSEVETLLSAAPTAQALLNLNRLAQVKHMALANRVWPNYTWLAWENRHNAQQPPVIDLIRRVFGYDLLKAVEETFGDEVVYHYWSDLDVPSEYDDITLDDDALDPLEDVPEDQIVDNPHLDIEVEIGEGFVFGSAETAACFRWLIESRHNHSHFVDNRTSYTNDPFSVQLAYDLRRSLKEGYWAALPPDTLPAWLLPMRSRSRPFLRNIRKVRSQRSTLPRCPPCRPICCASSSLAAMKSGCAGATR